MHYTLTRSARKTVAIYVRNGAVEVRAPLRMPERDIGRFVSEKEQWIQKHLSKQRAHMKEPFIVDHVCIRIYKRLAKSYIPKRVAFYSAKMGVQPASIKINSAMKRWGSCSSRKTLNFPWRLIMAEKDIVDYVVVHELAHLIEMNHSARFWAVVENILPDYRERQIKLTDLQNRLRIENWEG